MGHTTLTPFKVLRGGYLRFPDMPGVETIIAPAGGRQVMPARNGYIRLSTEQVGIQSSILPGFEPLLAGAKPLVAASAPSVVEFGGKMAKRVKIVSRVENLFLYLDPRTRLPVGIKSGSSGQTFTTVYEHVKLNAGLTPKDFDWVPPAGWSELHYPLPVKQGDPTAGLLEPKSKAPAFTLSMPAGGKTSLAAVLKGKRAVLLNFWFYG